MSEFPKLKTGAHAQYPATRLTEYRTVVLRFLDGTEQRYREAGTPSRRWELDFRLIDEEEAGRIQELFEGSQGRLESFEFEDPLEGMKKRRCSFEEDELKLELADESRSELIVRLRENKD